MLRAAQILLLAASLPIVSAISSRSACGLHAACAGLDGECCPTENGIQLDCCGVTGGHEKNADLQQAFQPILEAFRDVSPEKAVPVYAPDAVIQIFGMANGRKNLLCKGMNCHIKYWSALRSRLMSQETGKNIAEYIDNTSASGPDPRWNMDNGVVWNQWRAPDAHIDWASDTFIFDNATMKIAVHSMVFQGSLFDFGPQPSYIDAFSPDLEKFYWGVTGQGWLGHAKPYLSCDMPGILGQYAPDAKLHFVNHATGKSDAYGKGRDSTSLWYPFMKELCNEDFNNVDVLVPGDALKLFGANQSGLVIGNDANFDWYVPGPAHGITYSWAYDNIIFNELGKIKFHSIYWNRVPSGDAYTNTVSAPQPPHAPTEDA